MKATLKKMLEINASELNHVTVDFLKKQVMPDFKEYAGTGYIYDINSIEDEFIGENFPEEIFKSDIKSMMDLCTQNDCIFIQIDFNF